MTALSRHLARTLLALAVVLTGLAVLPEGATAAPKEKVTICHRTHSRTNPYNEEAVAVDSVYEGHGSHVGPVFGPGVDTWGDIIPPVEPDLPDGLNWNDDGRAVWENNCEIPPDPGPLPSASIGDVACSGSTPTVAVTVGNAADATGPATFTIRVNGVDNRTVGPVRPGQSETVTLAGAPEDTVAVIEVLSDGEVLAGATVTADCAPGPGPTPVVAIQAGFGCVGTTPQGTLTATNNTAATAEVTLRVDGAAFGTPVTVAAGATETRVVDGTPFEDRAITAEVVVDGTVVATYHLVPDCARPTPEPAARLVGTVCPPSFATVELSNEGDPGSSVDFFFRVDDRAAQRSAPLYGGDTTTVVLDLDPLEDRTARVRAGYGDDTVVVDRTVTVDCREASDADAGDGTADAGSGTADAGSGTAEAGSGVGGGEIPEDGSLPAVGSTVPRGVLVLGAGLLGAGAVLLLVGLRSGRPARR